MRYRVIPSRVWIHKSSNRRMSAFSVPSNPSDWTLTQVGWTVYDSTLNHAGRGYEPWKTESEALAWAAEHNRQE